MRKTIIKAYENENFDTSNFPTSSNNLNLSKIEFETIKNCRTTNTRKNLHKFD